MHTQYVFYVHSFIHLTGLQGELNAAQRDDEYVRKKLKLLEDEKNNLRQRYDEWEDEFKKKYGVCVCGFLKFMNKKQAMKEIFN